MSEELTDKPADNQPEETTMEATTEGTTMNNRGDRRDHTLWGLGSEGGPMFLWRNSEWTQLTGAPTTPDAGHLVRLPSPGEVVWNGSTNQSAVCNFVHLGERRSVSVISNELSEDIKFADWPGEWRLVDDVIREQREEIERLRTEAARSIGSTAALKMQRKSEYDRSCHLGRQLLAIRRHVKIFHANYGEEVGDEDDRDYIVGRCRSGEETIAAIDGIAADTDIPEDAVAMEEQAETIAEQAAEIERLKAELESQRSQHAARIEEWFKHARDEMVLRDDKIRKLESEIERRRTATASVETARESLDQSIVEEQAKRIRELEAKIEQLKSAHAAERERLAHDRRIDEHVIAQQAREIWGGGE